MFIIILVLIVAVLAVLFALENKQFVDIAFFGFQANEPLAIILLFSFLLGLAIGLLIVLGMSIKFAMMARKIKKEKEEWKRKAEENPIIYESHGLGKQGEFRLDKGRGSDEELTKKDFEDVSLEKIEPKYENPNDKIDIDVDKEG